MVTGRERKETLIRVALFSNTFKPIINGIVVSMEALRTFLESEGHEVYVFAPRYPGYQDSGAFVRRFPSFTLPAKVRFPLALPIAPQLFHEIERLQFDVFHSHHPFGMGVIARQIAHRLHRPLVTTIHTQYEQYLHYIPAPRLLSRPVMRHLVVRYCDACQAVTTPATGMAEVIRGYGVKNPVQVVPNGIDLRRYRTALPDEVRRKYALLPDQVVGLFTGRIAPEKNLPDLLEALRRVRERCPRFRLIVLGDGPDLPALKQQAAQMGLGTGVIFPGAVSLEQVAPYCAAADLFVTASTTEVNPTSVIEAMAAGTPIVAYDTFGAREIVRPEDGILTEHDPEALAQAILSLSENRERLASMADSAARSTDRFAPENTGKRMLEVYEQARARMA